MGVGTLSHRPMLMRVVDKVADSAIDFLYSISLLFHLQGPGQRESGDSVPLPSATYRTSGECLFKINQPLICVPICSTYCQTAFRKCLRRILEQDALLICIFATWQTEYENSFQCQSLNARTKVVVHNFKDYPIIFSGEI